MEKKKKSKFLAFLLAVLLWTAGTANGRALRYHQYVLFPASTRPLLPVPGVHHCHAHSATMRHAHFSASGHALLADESDCSAFYQCGPADFWGTAMVRRSCAHGLMFNLQTGTCDWPWRVRNSRPECRYEVGRKRFSLWRPKGSRSRSRSKTEERSTEVKKSKEKKKKKWKLKKKKKPSLLDLVFSHVSKPKKTSTVKDKIQNLKDSEKQKSGKSSAEEEKGEENSLKSSSNTTDPPSPSSSTSRPKRLFQSVAPNMNGRFDLGTLRVFSAEEFDDIEVVAASNDVVAVGNNVKVSVLK